MAEQDPRDGLVEFALRAHAELGRLVPEPQDAYNLVRSPDGHTLEELTAAFAALRDELRARKELLPAACALAEAGQVVDDYAKNLGEQ